MRRLATLAVLLGGLTICLGCGRSEEELKSNVPPGVSAVDHFTARLTHPMGIERKLAADDLAKLPPKQLKQAIPALEQAIAKEKEKEPKAAMQRALDAAKQAG